MRLDRPCLSQYQNIVTRSYVRKDQEPAVLRWLVWVDGSVAIPAIYINPTFVTLIGIHMCSIALHLLTNMC